MKVDINFVMYRSTPIFFQSEKRIYLKLVIELDMVGS